MIIYNIMEHLFGVNKYCTLSKTILQYVIMKDNNSLNYLLEIYKMKIETDGYIIHNYLCNCGTIHTVMFLFSNQDAAEIAHKKHITIIDKNNTHLTCDKCGCITDLFNMYLAIIEEKGYTIQNIEEINLIN